MKINPLKTLLMVSVLTSTFPALANSTTTPEALGFSSERLARLDQAMNEKVGQKQVAGAVTLLARHGKLVNINTYGQQDIAHSVAMKKDSIFRIYSMTKPVISAALMILFEEGKWLPSDPVAKYIPELANLKVYAGDDKNGHAILEAPAHAPTINELLTHTAGFSVGFFNTPVDKMYGEAKLWESGSLKEFIDKVAALPLKFQPGEAWEYSVAGDIEGLLIERLSGKPLPQFLDERIFKPLAMNDTGFYVPEQKLPRLAVTYQPEANSPLSPMPFDPHVSSLPAMPSGSGGLYSTAEDYFHFAQMLLNQGNFNGVQILSPASVNLMRANHLPDALRTGKYGIGFYHMQPGMGYGYNLAVIDDPVKLASTAGAGSYLWDGLAGTWFWVDPTNDLIFIGLIQRWGLAPGMPNLEDMSRAYIYQALVSPRK